MYGTDYPTPDGTAVRDYIHIEDLATAHLLALDGARASEHRVFNLGNGNGFSVREVVAAVGAVTGRGIGTKEAPRRPGDPPMLVASATGSVRSSAGSRASRGSRRWSRTPGRSPRRIRTATQSRSASSSSAAARTSSGGCEASIFRIRSGSWAASSR